MTAQILSVTNSSKAPRLSRKIRSFLESALPEIRAILSQDADRMAKSRVVFLVNPDKEEILWRQESVSNRKYDMGSSSLQTNRTARKKVVDKRWSRLVEIIEPELIQAWLALNSTDMESVAVTLVVRDFQVQGCNWEMSRRVDKKPE